MKQMSGVYPQLAHERDQGHTQKLCPVPSLTLKLLLMPPAADEPWRISWGPRLTWRLQVATDVGIRTLCDVTKGTVACTQIGNTHEQFVFFRTAQRSVTFLSPIVIAAN